MKPVQAHPARRDPARGFSLIEVLIALIVMSVGMLGIAGLYVHGMQAGRTSLFRHHAVTLAGDVADRIRANPTAGADYAAATATQVDACFAAGGCTAGEMAQTDIALWQEQADNLLPAADVTVAYDGSAVPSVYTVTIAWSEAGEDQTYEIQFPVYEM